MAMSSIIRKSLILEGLRSKWQHQHEISQSWYPCWEPKIPEPGMGADGSCCSFWIIVQCRIWQSKQKSAALTKPRSAICYCCPIIAYCTRTLTLIIGVSGHQCKILLENMTSLVTDLILAVQYAIVACEWKSLIILQLSSGFVQQL